MPENDSLYFRGGGRRLHFLDFDWKFTRFEKLQHEEAFLRDASII